MGVDDTEGRRLRTQMHQDANEHRVLDDVGEIAGMKGVAIVHRESIAFSGEVAVPVRRRKRVNAMSQPQARQLMAG